MWKTNRLEPAAGLDAATAYDVAAFFTIDPVKLTVPPLRVGIVERSTLVDQLEQSRNSRLVVVSAPAGYGKTTAMAQWAMADPRPFSWLTLDTLDNDPISFLNYVVSSLDTIEPLPAPVLKSLHRASPSVTTIVLPRLGAALARRPTPFVLVLDDVHLLDHPAVLECLEVLITRLPRGSQIALVGRGMPSLPVGRMRLEAQTVEIGAEHLIMAAAEARSIAKRAGVDLTSAEAERLVERTEGWPAGIYLAAIALREGAADTAIDDFRGDDRLIAQYLNYELMSSLPADLVDFLVKSSVLDRLSGPLCDTVLETSGSGHLLEELATSKNFFVVPLDRNQQQYRYHHLFSDLLRAELHARDSALERTLHARASVACEQVGDLDGAIRHAKAAGDLHRAGDLVYGNVLAFTGSGMSATVGLWLDQFDEAELANHPPAALAMAWYCLSVGQPEAVERWTDVAAVGSYTGPLVDGSPTLEVAVAILRAVVGMDGVQNIGRYTEIVRAHGPDGSPWFGLATMLDGAASLFMGDLGHAREQLLTAESVAPNIAQARAITLAELALLATEEGDWTRADDLAERARRIAETNGLEDSMPILPVYAISALLQAHAGRTEHAKATVRHARRLLIGLGHLAPRVGLLTTVSLARAELLSGDPVAAATLACEAERYVGREPEAKLLIAHLDEVRDQLATTETNMLASPQAVGPSALTNAELRVLEYLPTHLSFREIADRLYVSRNTVKSQAIAVYRKLGVSSRGGAVEQARALDLIGA